MVTNQKTYSLMWRVLCDILLFFSLFWAPPVFSFALGAALLFFLPRLYEFLIAAFLLDMLYGVPAPLWGKFSFVFSVAALAFFILSEWVKRRVRF